ncbi:MAG: 30S ribosomal protein S18 [Alphaproteobacteria bacterium GM7ARS4]|nr:30S ribosomal protein S18 [Alphaproteobacteria bacterium GM7ARS4]
MAVSPHSKKVASMSFACHETAAVDVRMLKLFLSERGRIMPASVTSLSRKNQRALVKAVKRARFLGLLPYVAE